LSGEGARRSGGRWNRVGTPLVYTSGSIALACLTSSLSTRPISSSMLRKPSLATGDLPLNRYLVKVEVPDALWKAAEIFDPKNHVGWDAIPTGRVSLDAGDAWAAARTSALLTVPSVIVPEERNILINPAHPDTTQLRAIKLRRWTYDPRLR
jgi:RES domain-containing protein